MWWCLNVKIVIGFLDQENLGMTAFQVLFFVQITELTRLPMIVCTRISCTMHGCISNSSSVNVYDQILNHEDEFCIDYKQNLVESIQRK